MLESGLPSTPLIQSPRIQVMEREGKYDPKRIPSSVFTRNESSSPADWSVASNESLFSIHVGNPSFGRDFSFLTGEDLSNSDELLSFGPSDTTAPVETVMDEEVEEMNDSVEKPAVVHVSRKDMAKTFPVDQEETKPSPPAAALRMSSVSRTSNESEASTYSFAFPILTRASSAVEEDKEPPLEAQNAGPSSEPLLAEESSGCFACFSCFSCGFFLSCCCC